MMRAVLLLTLLLCPLFAQALSFTDLASRTGSPQTLSGQFRQTKYLTLLDTSIESAGRFSYRRDDEIRWITQTPVADELVMTPQGIDGADNPVAALIGRIFFAVMSADWPVLEQHFTLSGELSEQGWQARLLPLDEEIAPAVERIELSGGDYLRRLELIETGGDRVRIDFSDLQP